MAAKLAGKIALVTGGGRGIGRGIALNFAEQGAKVVVADFGGPVDSVDAGSPGPADGVVAEIRQRGGDAVACYENIATMDGGRRAVDIAVDSFGGLDILVCAAGILVQKPLWEFTEDDWDSVITVHLKGHFSCTSAALKIMMPQHSGRLIFFSSAAAFGSPEQASYATAKAGIVGFTYSCSQALEDYGITANCILPGGATRMTDMIWSKYGQLTETVGQTLKSKLAEGTYRDPGNVAPLAAYLASEEATGITGQVFGAVGYQITRYRPMSADRTIRAKGPEGVDALLEQFPDTFGQQLRHERESWPPR